MRILGIQVAAAESLHSAMGPVRDGEEQLAELDRCGPCSMTFRVAAATSYAQAGALDASASYVDAGGTRDCRHVARQPAGNRRMGGPRCATAMTMGMDH